MEQKVKISKDLKKEIALALSECKHDKLFVLVDSVTKDLCWTIIRDFFSIKKAYLITIDATDSHKNLKSLTHVWEQLSENGATRHSCMINLGGGMVTDLGGFAASTFKRGIDFINIPTTLLAMVDASVGGKTGINFNGLKNEIGVFNNSKCVIIDTRFLKTLDEENLLSGYAEMIKHSLLSTNTSWSRLINFDIINPDLTKLADMVGESVNVKQRIVVKDPLEKGIRKALNLGHTFGHAFESWALRRKPILHGYAVAYGLVCELYLSATLSGFPLDKMRQTIAFINNNYGKLAFTCDDYDELIELMHHDKKNSGNTINFTLLSDIGDVKINQTATLEDIKNALDFYREG